MYKVEVHFPPPPYSGTFIKSQRAVLVRPISQFSASLMYTHLSLHQFHTIFITVATHRVFKSSTATLPTSVLPSQITLSCARSFDTPFKFLDKLVYIHCWDFYRNVPKPVYQGGEN